MDVQLATFIFKVSNALILPFWLIHLVAPYSKVSEFLARWKIGPLLVSIFYAFGLFTSFDLELFKELANPDLLKLTELFSDPVGVSVGWLHFLAFDLFVAETFIEKPKKLRISAWLLRVAIFFTLMMGPVGFVLFYLFSIPKIRKKP
jgi:hypothetical protein